MRSFAFASLFLAFGLVSAACGSTVDTTGSTSTTTTTTITDDTDTNTTPVVCTGLDFCACNDAAGCQVVYGDCICGCDYECPGKDPCVCACGGGPYLGCSPKSCQGPFSFPSTASVQFDEQGCPYVVK
jgi:hypothetical protein